MEFIREVKKEIQKLGYVESKYDIKIRPGTRNGRTVITYKGRGKRKGRRKVQVSGILGCPTSG